LNDTEGSLINQDSFSAEQAGFGRPATTNDYNMVWLEAVLKTLGAHTPMPILKYSLSAAKVMPSKIRVGDLSSE